MMKKDEIVDALNRACAKEYTAIIQFMTHASQVQGLDSDPVAPLLKEMAKDELGHVDVLLQRIWALGGRPTMDVGRPKFSNDVKEVLGLGIELEEEAVEMYRKLLSKLESKDDILLYETVEHLLEDEQGDLEKLKRLLER